MSLKSQLQYKLLAMIGVPALLVVALALWLAGSTSQEGSPPPDGADPIGTRNWRVDVELDSLPETDPLADMPIPEFDEERYMQSVPAGERAAAEAYIRSVKKDVAYIRDSLEAGAVDYDEMLKAFFPEQMSDILAEPRDLIDPASDMDRASAEEYKAAVAADRKIGRLRGRIDLTHQVLRRYGPLLKETERDYFTGRIQEFEQNIDANEKK
jgi:hypothetical protein